MRHHILPPHLVEHLAGTNEEFRQSLVVDAGIRDKRRVLPGPTTSDITVYDTKGSMDLPGEKVEGEGPVEAVTVRQHAESIKQLLGAEGPLPTTDIPDLVVNYGKVYPNAFFDGTYLVFGNGDGQVFGDFSVPLEVGAHEFGHKIISAGPDLEYAGQPGALNESIADVIGVCVKKRAATENAQDADGDDWTIGAGLFLPAVVEEAVKATGKKPALRDMANPGTAYDLPLLGKDPQVGHMDHYVETFEDNGGVHTNSGIPNKAFAEAATRIGGNAWEAPLRVWMSAMAKANGKTDFNEFAKLTIDAAEAVDAETKEHVVAAWKTVGLPEKADRPCDDNEDTMP